LRKQGLKIEQKEFYNLTRKEGKTRLSPQEELALLVGHLERHGYHPRTRDEYIVEDGVRKKKLVRDIFFMSDDQIRLARRFVSGFIYETDATFNTNTLRLPLSVMVGIDNTGCTFPMAFMFITSESAKSFTFASEQLTDLCFYDCSEAAIICGDFSKGLGASIALRACQELSTKEGFIDIDDIQEAALDPKPHGAIGLLESDTIVVNVSIGYQGERVLL
jgi:MULE transposase domain